MISSNRSIWITSKRLSLFSYKLNVCKYSGATPQNAPSTGNRPLKDFCLNPVRRDSKKVNKHESFVFRSFFGEFDKACLRNSKPSLTKKEFHDLQSQYDYIRKNYRMLFADRRKLCDLGFFNLHSFSTYEQCYLFEAIGASLCFRDKSSSTDIITVDSRLASYAEKKSFLQSVISLVTHNGLVAPTLKLPSSPFDEDFLASLNDKNVAFAFCEPEETFVSITYPYWVSKAQLNTDLDSWFLNGAKSQILKSEYDYFLLFCKVNPKESQKLSDYQIASFLVDKNKVNISDDGCDSYGNSFLKINFQDLQVPVDSELSFRNKLAADSSVPVLNVKANGQLLSSAITFGLLKESFANLLNLYKSSSEIPSRNLVENQLLSINQKIYSLESMLYMTASNFDTFDINQMDLFLHSLVVKIFAAELASEIVNSYRFLVNGSRFSNVAPPDINDVLNFLDSFLDSSTSNRLLLAIYGLRQIGKWRYDHIAKLRLNKIYMYHFIKSNTLSFDKKMSQRSSDSLDEVELLNSVHKSLKKPAESLKEVLSTISEMGNQILKLYGKDVVHNQIDCNRFATMVMHAFQMIAVISRTQANLEKSDEVILCQQICGQAHQDVKHLEKLILGVLDTSEEMRSKAIHKRNVRFDGYFARPTFDRII